MSSDSIATLLFIPFGINLFLLIPTLRMIGGGNSVRRIPSRGCVGGVIAGLAYKNRWPLGYAYAAAIVIWLLSAGLGALHYLALWRFLPSMESTPSDFLERTGRGEGSNRVTPPQAARR